MHHSIYAKTGFTTKEEATPNAAITRPVTVGLAVTSPSLISERDISYVMDCVRKGSLGDKDLKAVIVTIRSLPAEQAALAAGMKRALPWFSGSTFNRRRANEFFKSAWFMVFDLDHIPDIAGLKRRAVDKLPFIRYAFQSVRDGVKLVAEFRSPITREEDFRTIWSLLALQVAKVLKVEVDSTPDPARACFLSYDPELLTNPNCKPLDPKQTIQEANSIQMLMESQTKAPQPPKPPIREISVIRGQETDFEKASKTVQNLAQRVITYSDWYRVGLALYAGFGEAGRPLWDLFLANPHYRDTQREIDAKWRSFRSVREITLATLFEIGARYGV